MFLLVHSSPWQLIPFIGAINANRCFSYCIYSTIFIMKVKFLQTECVVPAAFIFYITSNQWIVDSLFVKRTIFVKRLRGAGFGYGWASKAILNRRDLSCDRKLSIDEAVRTWRGSEFQIWGAAHEKRLSVIAVVLHGSINKWISADHSKRTGL